MPTIDGEMVMVNTDWNFVVTFVIVVNSLTSKIGEPN